MKYLILIIFFHNVSLKNLCGGVFLLMSHFLLEEQDAVVELRHIQEWVEAQNTNIPRVAHVGKSNDDYEKYS